MHTLIPPQTSPQSPSHRHVLRDAPRVLHKVPDQDHPEREPTPADSQPNRNPPRDVHTTQHRDLQESPRPPHRDPTHNFTEPHTNRTQPRPALRLTENSRTHAHTPVQATLTDTHEDTCTDLLTQRSTLREPIPVESLPKRPTWRLPHTPTLILPLRSSTDTTRECAQKPLTRTSRRNRTLTSVSSQSYSKDTHAHLLHRPLMDSHQERPQ